MGTRLVATSLVVSLTGCGLTMTKGPDEPVTADVRPVCTESMNAPKMDAIPAALGFFTILTGLLFLKAGDNATVGVPLVIGGGAVMVGSYVSGGIGYFRVKRCQEAIQRHYQLNDPGLEPTSAAPLLELEPAVAARTGD